jgi:hypothetical protein
MEGFKARYSVKFKTLHGEAASVEPSTITNWFTRKMFIIANYDSCYTFNLDETGLFYRAGRGKKVNKERVTVLVGASMYGNNFLCKLLERVKNQDV